ncbi:MAG: hypothetical protein DIJKHBIC_04641 [Thermoanaerobaculia bacterium]|nr:hypothetical protein [Thermoanaerobaculia bacterium]
MPGQGSVTFLQGASVVGRLVSAGGPEGIRLMRDDRFLLHWRTFSSMPSEETPLYRLIDSLYEKVKGSWEDLLKS